MHAGAQSGTQAPPAKPGLLHRMMGHFGQHGKMGTTGKMPMMSGRIVGNKRSHVYHLPGDKGSLPAPQNRIYFRTESEARAAGYHLAGKSPMGGHMMGSHGMSHTMMGHGAMGHHKP